MCSVYQFLIFPNFSWMWSTTLYFAIFKNYSTFWTFWIYISDDKKSDHSYYCVVFLQISHQLTWKAESRFKRTPAFYRHNKNTNKFKKAKEIHEETETCGEQKCDNILWMKYVLKSSVLAKLLTKLPTKLINLWKTLMKCPRNFVKSWLGMVWKKSYLRKS